MPGMPPMPPAPPPTKPTADPQVVGFYLGQMSDAELQDFLENADDAEQFALLQAIEGQPDLIQRVLAAMPDPETEGPEYPANYVKPPKPDYASILEWATTLESRYSLLKRRWRDDLETFYSDRRVGTFNVDRQDNDFQRFYSSGLADDANLAITQVGALPVTYQLDAPRRDTKRDAQEAEDFVRHVNCEVAYRHAEAGNGDLGMDEAKCAVVYGVVVSREVLNLGDPDLPIHSELLDPGTCYPYWAGRKGLQVMVRTYCDSIANIAGDFDADGTLEKRLFERNKTNRANRRDRATRLTEQVDVIEYWDTWWRAVYLRDGTEVVKPTAHEYGFVPFVYQRSSAGRPAFARTLHRTGIDTTTDGSEIVTREDQQAELDAAVSFFHWRKKPHAQYEAVMSKLMQVMSKADRPPLAVFQDWLAREAHDTVEVDYDAGKINTFMMGNEEVRPLLETAPPNLFGPLLQAIAQDKATGQLPLSMYGASASAAGATGNALEGMNESGRDKLTNVVLTRQIYKAQQAAMWLKIWANFGHLWGQDGEKGAYEVPYAKNRRDATAPTFALTPATVRRAGNRVTVKLTSLRLQNLPAFLNAGAIGLQTDQMTLREALELRGVENPMDYIMERIEEKALLNPENQAIVEVVAALNGGDPVLAKLLYERLKGSGGQPPTGGPGGPPPGALGLPGPAGPNTSGMDLSAISPGVGAGAGRPVGPPPPPPGSVQIAPPSGPF